MGNYASRLNPLSALGPTPEDELLKQPKKFGEPLTENEAELVLYRHEPSTEAAQFSS